MLAMRDCSSREIPTLTVFCSRLLPRVGFSPGATRRSLLRAESRNGKALLPYERDSSGYNSLAISSLRSHSGHDCGM